MHTKITKKEKTFSNMLAAVGVSLILVGFVLCTENQEEAATAEEAVIVMPEVTPIEKGVDHGKFLDALWQVEASGQWEPADGDGGNAIGPYQIWEAYWLDAVEFSGLGGTYEDCRNKVYAEKVIKAYMMRYKRSAWESGDWEIIARTHNGGPRGATKKATLGYWAKVQKAMGVL